MNDERIPNKEVLLELLALAIKAATAPTDKILSYFRASTLTVQSKKDGSPVTVADREAEEMIRDVLSSETPIGCLDILGEEQGLLGRGTRFRWTIDPIDGTRSFVQGIPLFGTIVALEDTTTHAGLLGVIHLPVFNKSYFGARGVGSWCDKTRLTVSTTASPDRAIISVGDPLQFHNAKLEGAYNRLIEICPCLRGYTDCFGHALVASGAVGAMVDPTLNPWDVIATQVLIEEGGGSLRLRPLGREREV